MPKIILIIALTFFFNGVEQAVSGCIINQDAWNKKEGSVDNLNYGQSFTAACTGTIKSITVHTLNDFGDTGIPEVTILIYSGSGGTSGSAIAQENFISSPNTEPGLNSHTYNFAEKIPVAFSNEYSIIFDTNNIAWFPVLMEPSQGDTTDYYSDGTFIDSNTTLRTNDDLRFSLDIVLPGDIDGNNSVELQDAVLSLQIMSSFSPAEAITLDADVNNDGLLGLPEAIHILGQLSGN